MPLAIFGAGYDAMPVVRLAKKLGWQVTVVDSRPAYATKEWFPLADDIIMTRPTEPTKATVPTSSFEQRQQLIGMRE